MILFLVKNRLVVSIVFYILWGASFFAHVLELEETTTEIMVWISNAILFVFWLIILLDIINTKIRDKTFWVLSMILLPFFAPMVYIFRRKNLIHLEDNTFKNSRHFK